MKKLNIIVAILLALGLSSCSDSFFDLTPNDQVTRPQVYKTENDFKLAVNACYSKLQTQMDFYVEMCEFRSDELTLNAPTAGTQDRYDIDQFKDVPSNGILDNLWANFNNGVYGKHRRRQLQSSEEGSVQGRGYVYPLTHLF